jgi:16S rRNA (uracil1498-N3)-methyltransferase
MRRFYLATPPQPDNTVSIRGTEAHHISQVLRLKPGAQIEFFTHEGTIYTATLTNTTRNLVTALIEKEKSCSTSINPCPLTLIQAIPKGKKMDTIIQKATELGASQVMPVTTRYCDTKSVQDKQLARWQRIMLEACKQSHRPNIMHITPSLSLEEIDFRPFRHRILALENEHNSIQYDFFKNAPGAICLCIGPEGGWHQQEIEYLQHHGCTPVSLGNNILRSETASISGIAIIQYLTQLY